MGDNAKYFEVAQDEQGLCFDDWDTLHRVVDAVARGVRRDELARVVEAIRDLATIHAGDGHVTVPESFMDLADEIEERANG